MGKENNILKCFGSRIRKLRKDKGLSQEAFAILCDLDRTYIGGIERGERNIALKNIKNISKALNISLSELMKDL